MFSRHYHSELSFLREMGRSFAQSHPNTAGMLGERGGDPDVERLLEGFSFLAARIRERLDDEVPEVIHELCGLLLPHYLRSIPASSIVEFSPPQSTARGSQRMSAGTEILAVPVEQTSCRFRTTQPVHFLPVSLSDAILEGPQSSAPLLRLVFQGTQGTAEGASTDAGIRLFLHGEFAVATTLWLWFLRHCQKVTLRGPGGEAISLGSQVIQPVGFAPEDALLPWPRLAPGGYRLLQEYFTLPQKFLFIDLKPLTEAKAFAKERFEIAFTFDRPPELPGRLSTECFRLYCAPVVNLFQASAEPVRSDLPGAEHLLRPMGVAPQHAEVYSVDSVTGLRRGRAERTRYSPFFSFEHLERPSGQETFYRLRRELSPTGDGLDTYLTVGSPRDVVPSLDSLDEEVISIDLTCTNRALAGRVRAGDISLATASSPQGFKNLVAATKPVAPLLGSELHWRLVGHLSLGQRSIQDTESLRALLSLYDFQGAADPQANANRRRIEAIQSVEVLPARRLVDGAALRGVTVVVELNEASFASRGEAVLFGSILDELLASRVTLNSFIELRVRLQPSRAEYTWAPRNGSQALL